MAAPTIEAFQQTNYTTQTATGVDEVTASVSWLAGDFIVVVGQTEDSTATIDTPTATGLTFSLLDSATGASNCQVYIWTATAGADGSSAITANTVSSGSRAKGIGVFVIRGHDGIGNNAKITGSTAKVIALTRAGTDSVVIAAFADWAAINDTTVNPTPATNGIVRLAVNSAPYSAFTVSWTSQGAPGSDNYGITDHTGTVDMSGLVVEVKGAAAGGGATPPPKQPQPKTLFIPMWSANGLC